jgi:tripartite-type tricarboxylate transporter receptor subunit TctC
MKFVRHHALVAGAMIAALAASSVGWAQHYPARPVRVIVPFAPGGATDIIARPILQELSKRLGQHFYVENMPGASGNIGTAHAAKAAPDGYTLLLAFSSHATNPSMFDKLPFDPVKDFAPITIAVRSPAVLSVHPSLPPKTVHELVALIKTNPGKYSFASGGTGPSPISLANSSACPSDLISCTCHTTGAGRHSHPRSPGTRQLFSAPSRRRCLS